LLVRVEREDMPHVGEVDENVDDGGLESDRFDKPFVARVEDNNNTTGEAGGEVNIDAIDIDDDDDDFAVPDNNEVIEEVSVVDSVRKEAEESSSRSSYPIGTPVVIDGLLGEQQQKYNGVSAVVVTSLNVDMGDTTSSGGGAGRHGVRMSAPFAGKRLMVHPLNMTVRPPAGSKASTSMSDDDDDNDDDEDDDDDMNGVDGPINHSTDESGDILGRYCRILGIDPLVLGLQVETDGKKKSTASANHEDVTNDTDDTNNVADPFLYGFGLSGTEPVERLQSALRAATRDTSGDHYGLQAVEEAGSHLLEVIKAQAPPSYANAVPQDSDTTAKDATRTTTMMPPHLLVISGILGPRAAAAASASHSLHDLNIAERGVSALRKLLSHEIRRRSNLFSLTEDDNGADEVRLRCTIVSALLHGNRDATALKESSEAARRFPLSTSASFLRARCLFRRAMRAEALVELQRAATGAAAPKSLLLKPDSRWAHGEAVRMLRAVSQAETRRIRAVDA
jgi:hypothetical protein